MRTQRLVPKLGEKIGKYGFIFAHQIVIRKFLHWNFHYNKVVLNQSGLYSTTGPIFVAPLSNHTVVN